MVDSALHIPVLRNEVLEALQTRTDGVFVDATFGVGGYTRAMLEAGAGEVIGLDRDPAAIARASALAREYGNRFAIHHSCFGDMAQVIAPASVQGVAFDLGVSSPQLDEAERGFSFRGDGPLDMRMDNSRGASAADLVNNMGERELADLIFKYGEERRSRAVAAAIVAERRQSFISSTLQLAKVVRSVVRTSPDGIDPATRTFQALRIAVNDELGELERGLTAAEQILAPGGRLAVVTFHSLEDRIVKDFLRDRSGNAPRGSRHLPEKIADPVTFILVGKKPVTPSDAELRSNPRARSAKLRVAERTATPARS